MARQDREALLRQFREEIEALENVVGVADHPDRIRIEDCVITSDLSDAGDSGSPVYLTSTGALCGLYFAG